MDEDQPIYIIVNLETGKESSSSRNFTGRAKATYPNGETYEGDYVDGIREGQGKYTYKNKYTYEGQWVQNQKDGRGIFTYRKKGKYDGNFRAGKREGTGCFYYPNEDVYEGEWKDGAKNGTGRYTFNSSKQHFDGQWLDNAFVRGTWFVREGLKFEGEFLRNMPYGKGKWINETGNRTDSVYEHIVIEDEEEETPEDITDEFFEQIENEVPKAVEELKDNNEDIDDNNNDKNEKPEQSEEEEEEGEDNENKEESEPQEPLKKYRFVHHNVLGLYEQAIYFKEMEM